MYRDLLADARFHKRLLAFDCELGEAARGEGCRLCCGVLHSARFPRKPRGRPCRLGPEHDWRISFCCALDGCRSRRTPASLRFLGRKIYLAAVVVLVSIMRHGMTAARMQRLSHLSGMDRRTVERWRVWWRDVLTATPLWRSARAAFMPPVDQNRLPAALIERFAGDDTDRLIALLRLLGPITGGVRAEHGADRGRAR